MAKTKVLGKAPEYEEIELDKIEIGDYACHFLDEQLIKWYMENDIMFFYSQKLSLSKREGRYFILRGFEAYEALKRFD